MALGLRQRRHRQPGTAPVRHRALGPRQERAPGEGRGARAATSDAPASQETPDTHTSFFEYADGTILEFATRGGLTNDEGTRRIGNLFYGSEGWLWIDADGGKWQSYLGRKNEPGPGFTESTGEASSDPLVLTSQELLHYQNFVDAVRANDPKLLTSGIEDGHLSAALAHLANVSYRVGRQLRFDGAKEQVVGDAEANALLTRPYRAPFVIPEKV